MRHLKWSNGREEIPASGTSVRCSHLIGHVIKFLKINFETILSISTLNDLIIWMTSTAILSSVRHGAQRFYKET